jgi:hypothetical protein
MAAVLTAFSSSFDPKTNYRAPSGSPTTGQPSRDQDIGAIWSVGTPLWAPS